MSTTPLWVPLLVAGLGIVGTVAGTISGVVLTQRQAARREALSWDRERKREEQRWAREDLARTFEHRRIAYIEFYESLRETALIVYNHGWGLSPPTDGDDDGLPFDFALPTYHKLQHLEIYATPLVVQAAQTTYRAVWRWGASATFDQVDEEFSERNNLFERLEVELLDAIRMDLGIPVLPAKDPNPLSRRSSDSGS